MTTTYDVAAFQTDPANTGVVPQELWSLTSGDGLLVTGIIKLCQRFLLELFTVKGSIPFDTDRGSSLLTFVRQGNIRNDIDAYIYFQFAVQEVKQYLQSQELATDDPDEQFQTLTIDSVAFSYTAITYHVTLTSNAGSSRVVSVPLTTSP